MPASKGRHPHKHPHHTGKTVTPHPKPKQSNRLVLISSVFFAFLGLAISFFANATSPTSLLMGAVAGALVGLIIGFAINKSISKK